MGLVGEKRRNSMIQAAREMVARFREEGGKPPYSEGLKWVAQIVIFLLATEEEETKNFFSVSCDGEKKVLVIKPLSMCNATVSLALHILSSGVEGPREIREVVIPLEAVPPSKDTEKCLW